MSDVTLLATSFGKAIVQLLDGVSRVPWKVTALMISMIVVAIVVGQVFIH